MKKLQLFIHKQYDNIKLTLLVLLVALSVFTILSQLAQNDKAARERSAAVTEVARAVKAESEKQTEIINRQFRALCVIIIETSGQEGLDKLDAESRRRCSTLADFTEAGAGEVIEPAVVPSVPQDSNFSSPNTTPQPAQTQQEKSLDSNTAPEQPDEQEPDEPEPNLIQQFMDRIRGLLGG